MSRHAVFSEPGYTDIYQDTYDFGTQVTFTAEGVGQHPSPGRSGGRLVPYRRQYRPPPLPVVRAGSVVIAGVVSAAATGNPGRSGGVHIAAISITAANGDGSLFNDDDELIMLGVI